MDGMKRFSSILMVILLIMTAAVPTFAASVAMVEKVVFRDLDSTFLYTGLGGIRFYNAGNMMDSGAFVSGSPTYGETEQFKVTASESYTDTNTYYSLPNPVDTSRLQNGRYTDYSYWIMPENKTAPGILTIEFKVAQTIDTIEFIPLPDTMTGRGVDKPFSIDVYEVGGAVQTYAVTPITENNTVQTLQIESAATPTLDVQAATYELNAGDTVNVDVVLSNITDIYAEDFTVSYDPTAFELVSETVSSAAYNIFHTDKNTSGQARYIVASNGGNNGINAESGLVTLSFKAKNFDGASDIAVTSGLVADSQGNEFTTTNLAKTFTITPALTDVNGDEIFSLGDLAIASNLFATASSVWGTYTPDVDADGQVGTTDLHMIVAEILK